MNVDSLKAIDIINKDGKKKNVSSTLVHQILLLLAKLKASDIVHTFREENRCADE